MITFRLFFHKKLILSSDLRNELTKLYYKIMRMFNNLMIKNHIMRKNLSKSRSKVYPLILMIYHTCRTLKNLIQRKIILPNHITKSILTPTYDFDFTSKTNYLMSNYICNRNLSNSNIAFISQLSNVSIHDNVHKALAYFKWKDIMNEEMKSWQKNET